MTNHHPQGGSTAAAERAILDALLRRGERGDWLLGDLEANFPELSACAVGVAVERLHRHGAITRSNGRVGASSCVRHLASLGMSANVVTLTVPAEIVGPLRGGLHTALGEAAQAIDNATLEAGREVASGFYDALLARFDRVRALLDAIEWGDETPARPVSLDLAGHREALLLGLDVALAIVDAEVAEPPEGKEVRSERADQRVELQRSLREFAAVAIRADGDPRADGGESSRELLALGAALRELRAERSVAPDDLAREAGLSRARLDAIEGGRFDPRYDVLLGLARGLGVGLSEIATRIERHAQLLEALLTELPARSDGGWRTPAAGPEPNSGADARVARRGRLR